MGRVRVAPKSRVQQGCSKSPLCAKTGHARAGLILGHCRWLLSRLDRRCGTHEQLHELRTLRRVRLRVNVLEVGFGGVLADP
jgi:hypothetical protein